MPHLRCLASPPANHQRRITLWMRQLGPLPQALIAAALVGSCAEPTRPAGEERAGPAAAPAAGFVATTRVTVDGNRFRINGAITYRGAPAEGQLMNVRMVHAVFEDTNRPEFDPAANTQEFVARMPEYVSLGVRAFTVGLQGGWPGYLDFINTAFLKNGDLKPTYLARVAKVIERADALGAVIILVLYYQRQDHLLQDGQAIRNGVARTADWLRQKGYRNVILEVVNEYKHRGFQHDILHSDASVADLIRLARQRYPGLLVSASHVRNGKISARVAGASDLIIVHYNSLTLSEFSDSVKAIRRAYPGKPILCNEDQRVGSAAAAAASASVRVEASYGLMLERQNQHYPFEFHGRADDPVVYDRYVALTR
jgi:hypothetical protein